jgi:hypothetical protein
MKRPRIERVPPGYAPRYPTQLTGEEYRELIAADASGRAVAAAVAAGLLCPGTAVAQGGDREAAFVDLLNKGLGQTAAHSNWFEQTTFSRERNAYDSPVVVPRIPIAFGNSHNGVFDAGRAKQLALQLFAVYGLKAVADQVVREEGVEAKLDGYDRERKVGFKLRGAMPEPNQMFAAAKAEPAATDLDVDEHKLLAARGTRVHVADLAQYPLMDGDQFTPTIAWLAGIVDFLNAVTDGPDLSLEAILLDRRQHFPLPKLELPPEVKGESSEQGSTLEAQGRALVVLRIDPQKGAQVRKAPGKARAADEWQAVERPLPTAGRLSMLRIACIAQSEGARAGMRIDQAGSPVLQVDAAGPTAFLPAGFDATRPFTITLQLEKGRYWIGPNVLVGAKGP